MSELSKEIERIKKMTDLELGYTLRKLTSDDVELCHPVASERKYAVSLDAVAEIENEVKKLLSQNGIYSTLISYSMLLSKVVAFNNPDFRQDDLVTALARLRAEACLLTLRVVIEEKENVKN